MSAVRILAGVVMTVLAPSHALPASDEPGVTVRENSGTYVVTARFTVARAPEVAHAVLTDYDNIDRFMPDIRTSRVVARQDGRVRIEQEAVSRYLFFSKRVHLILDIEEEADVIRFRDRCNQSFLVYDGAWTIMPRGGITVLTYELTARPAFSVPGFVLRKLLRRDSQIMIDRLRAEIHARKAAR